MMLTLRKLTGCVAFTCMLTLTTVAAASDAIYVARLDGTRMEPDAMGRALWMATPSEIHLSVGIENCQEHDAVWVMIGAFVHRMPIHRGEGEIHINVFKNDAAFSDFPRVAGGSPIAIYSTDGDLILFGRFRQLMEPAGS